MADELFGHRPKQNVWPMCSVDIALSKYMAVAVTDIVLRYCDIVFGESNYTKNKGACVDSVIWLAGLCNEPN